MSDFEVVQPQPQQPPALQMALDHLEQRRAYERAALQERQLWEDAQPPTLTYLGQSNGQPLLQAAGGQPFRAGNRDSNGSLLPGLADVAIAPGVLRVGGMPRVQTETTETTQFAQKFAILFAKTTATTIQFWLGGDRPAPILVTEIPRFGREFNMNPTINNSLTFVETLKGLIGASTDGEFVGAGVDIFQPHFFQSLVASGGGSGSATLVATEYLGLAQIGARMTGPGGFFAEGGGTLPTGALPISIFDTANVSQPPPEPTEFYTEPFFLLRQEADDKPFGFSGTIAGNTASGEDEGGETVSTTTMFFSASATIVQREANLYRAYLSVTSTTAYVFIGYDVRDSGFVSLLHFAVSDAGVVELEEASAEDWRSSLAIPTVLPLPSPSNPQPDFPPSVNSCFNQYRRNFTTNVYRNKLYEIENGWLQEVTVGGIRTNLYQAIAGSEPVKVKLKLKGLTNSGDACQIGTTQNLEMEVQSLQLAGEDVTFIAACAAKD